MKVNLASKATGQQATNPTLYAFDRSSVESYKQKCQKSTFPCTGDAVFMHSVENLIMGPPPTLISLSIPMATLQSDTVPQSHHNGYIAVLVHHKSP